MADAPCFACGVDPEGNPWCRLPAGHDEPHSTADGNRALNDARLVHIRERLTAYRPAPGATSANRAIEDMQWLIRTVDDLRSRLACVVEASYWDRPYDTRLDAIRGMCDLTTDGMTPASEIREAVSRG